MTPITFGLIREGKVPIDKRVPLTPAQAVAFQKQFGVKVVVQTSPIRCYTDDEYRAAGVEVVDNVADCDVLLGVKEVPIKDLIKNKTYFFFSHTTKEQPYNRTLLQAIIANNIKLIDYENLTTPNGQRVVAFGRYAGIVGAYNGIMTYGKRYHLFDLRPAYTCYDLNDLTTEYAKVKLPAIKIVLTGAGRVAHGAMEVLDAMGIKKVSVDNFLNQLFEEPVYCQIHSDKYNKTDDGRPFDSQEFHENPTHFMGDFLKYARVADVLIAGAYWDPRAPVLFTQSDAQQPWFKLKVIADITCDIEGSIPSTLRASTIAEPIYDYDAQTGTEKEPLSSENHITVMAVDNLPCELPINASNDFGEQLMQNVLPHLFNNDTDEVIKRATITQQGKLTKKYKYLQNYIDGKS